MRQSGFRLLVIFLAAVPMAPAWAAGVEAYCAELQWVLLAPDGGGTVQVIDVRRGVTPLATLRSRQRGRIVALRVQVANRRVWVLADNGLDVHDGFSGRLLGHWPAPDGARLDRLEVDASGRLSVWSGTQCFEPVAGGALGGCGATCARPCAAAAGASERSISSSTGDGSFRRPA
mgnify:CR=1 FL=1